MASQIEFELLTFFVVYLEKQQRAVKVFHSRFKFKFSLLFRSLSTWRLLFQLATIGSSILMGQNSASTLCIYQKNPWIWAVQSDFLILEQKKLKQKVPFTEIYYFIPMYHIYCSHWERNGTPILLYFQMLRLRGALENNSGKSNIFIEVASYKNYLNLSP